VGYHIDSDASQSAAYILVALRAVTGLVPMKTERCIQRHPALNRCMEVRVFRANFTGMQPELPNTVSTNGGFCLQLGFVRVVINLSHGAYNGTSRALSSETLNFARVQTPPVDSKTDAQQAGVRPQFSHRVALIF
jgi:hypothetical protein